MRMDLALCEQIQCPYSPCAGAPGIVPAGSNPMGSSLLTMLPSVLSSGGP